MKRAGSDDGSTPHTGLVPTDETHQRHVDDARVKSATHLETSAGETAPATSAAVRHDDAASTEHAATRANGTAPAGPAAAGSARHATDARGAISSSRATGNRTNVASEQACNAASRAAARYTRLKKLPSRAGAYRANLKRAYQALVGSPRTASDGAEREKLRQRCFVRPYAAFV